MTVKSMEIQDLAFDAGLERPKVVAIDDWGGARIHILTFGAQAQRKTLELPGHLNREQVKQALKDEALKARNG